MGNTNKKINGGLLGGDEGLTYNSLFDKIPFWFKAGLSEELIDELEGEE